ncbi:MAG: hypothetical protein U0821_02895 [Chloroflexota bacterium]
MVHRTAEATERSATRALLVPLAGIVALSLAIRLAWLGDPPLDTAESRRALEGWTLWREARVAYESAPMFTNLLSAVFGLFGGGEIQARLVPTLLGAALSAAAVLLYPFEQRARTIATAIMLALTPSLIVASRSASPEILVAASTVVVAGAAYQYTRGERQVWLTTALVALVAGLGSDPSFVPAVGTLILAVAIAEGDSLVRAPWWAAARRHLPTSAAIAVTMGVLLDSRALMNLAGVQAGLVDPFWRWLGDVVRGGGLTAPAVVGLRDGACLMLAIVGLASYRTDYRRVRLLAAWLLVSLTLTALVRQPDPRYLLLPAVPAALLAGLGLAELWTYLAPRMNARVALTTIALFAPFVTAAFHVNTTLASNPQPWMAALAVVAAGLLIVALASLSWLNRAELIGALLGFIPALALVWTVSTASRLIEARGSERAQLTGPTAMTAEMRTVREEVLRWQREDPIGRIIVDPALRPLVAWALRDIPTLRYESDTLDTLSPRLLAGAPASVGEDVRARAVTVGYATEWNTLSLTPARLWRWVFGRQNLVDQKAYAILVVQPAGR